MTNLMNVFVKMQPPIWHVQQTTCKTHHQWSQ